MPKEKIIQQGDPEEIGKPNVVAPLEKGMSPEVAELMDGVRKMQEQMAEQQHEIIRLKAIADQNKGRTFDKETADKSFKGTLRYLEDVSDPVIHWSSTKNVSFVDPTTGALVQDQRALYKTLKGIVKELDIHEWTRISGNQTHFKFLKLDHQNSLCDIQLSTDGGQTYLGEVIKDLSLTFVNP